MSEEDKYPGTQEYPHSDAGEQAEQVEVPDAPVGSQPTTSCWPPNKQQVREWQAFTDWMAGQLQQAERMHCEARSDLAKANREILHTTRIMKREREQAQDEIALLREELEHKSAELSNAQLVVGKAVCEIAKLRKVQ